MSFEYHQQFFNGGIYDPLMQGGASRQEYATSVRDALNYLPIPQGPVIKRPGTKFVFPALSTESRLVNVTYANDKAYCLEFSNFAIRFFTDGGVVLNGLNPFQLVSPYSIAEAQDIVVAQNGDDVYIAHPSHPPHKLTPNGSGFWVINTAAVLPIPMGLENATDISMAYTSIGSRVDSSTAYFDASDVGRQLRLRYTTRWVIFKITGFVTSTRVTGVLVEDPTYVNPDATYTAITDFTTVRWAISVWGTQANRIGYPSVVAFSQQRLVYGGYVRKPKRINASHDGGFYDCFSLSTPISDSTTALSAYSIEMASGQRNKIKWIETDEGGMLIGTEANEFTVAPASNSQGIQGINIVARSWSRIGSSIAKTAKADELIYFVSKTGSSIHVIASNSNLAGKYSTVDMSYKVRTLLDKGIKDIVFVRAKHPALWVLMNDGTLMSCSVDKATNTIAYARHAIAEGSVKSITSILDAQGAYEELWCVVNRTSGSVIERVSQFYKTDADVTDYPYVDCAFEYAGVETNQITAPHLNLLNGKKVQVVADGVFIQEAIVAAGAVQLNTSVTKAFLGLKYDAFIEMQTPEIPTRTYSTTVGLVMLVDRVKVQVYDTVGVNMYGPHAYENTFRNPQDTEVKPYTGFKNLTYVGYTTPKPLVILGSSVPFPSTILSVRMRVDIKGDADGFIGG